MSRGEDIATLVGTGKRSRFADNLAAQKQVLDPQMLAELDRAFGLDAFAGQRYDPQQMRVVAG